MSLKELTWENHKKAERKKFASVLMSGDIEPELYFKYLTNQFLMYSVLEQKIDLESLGLNDIRRSSLILQDMMELGFHTGDVNNYSLPVAKDYIQYISTMTSEQLIPHMYVRHF